MFIVWKIRKRRRLATNLLIVSFIFFGMSHVHNFNSLRGDDIYYYAKKVRKNASLEGIVVSQPKKQDRRTSFVFKPRTIRYKNSEHRISGLVFAQTYRKIDVAYGDAFILEGKISLVKDTGFFNKSLIRKKIKTKLFLKKFKKIILKTKKTIALRKFFFSVRDKLKDKFNQIAYPANEFLKAMLLADRSGISHEIISIFKYTGTIHILAISGLHIGIIVFMLLVFLKVLRIKQKARFIIAVIFLIAYCCMTGFRPSVVRAVIMAIMFLLSFIVARQYQIYNSLSLAAIIILIFAPWQIFDVGFQLSFISVISIIVIGPRILKLLPKPKNRLIYFMLLSFIISLSVWLGTAILVAYYFGIITPISIVVNVVIVSLVPFIIGSGFIFLLFSFLSKPLANLISVTIEYMIELLLFIVACFSKVPFAFFYTDRVILPIVIGYYALFLMILISITLIYSRKLRRIDKYR